MKYFLGLVLHAPEADFISKGKAHKRYEFGVKASEVTLVIPMMVIHSMINFNRCTRLQIANQNCA